MRKRAVVKPEPQILPEANAIDRGIAPPAARAFAFVLIWPVAILASHWASGAIFCRGATPFCTSAAYGVASAALVCVATLVLAFGFRRFVDREPADTLGLGFHAPWLRLFAIGAAFGAGMQGFVYLLEWASGSLHIAGAAPLRSDVGALESVLPLLALAAVSEELPVRGYLFQNLRSAWGDRIALVITSLLFALLHIANPSATSHLGLTLAGIALAGAWFCLSVIWTRSLWLALGAHIAWNLFEGPVFGLPVSGLYFGNVTALTTVVTGPSWFTGGAFGPEAGLSSFAALAAGAAVLYGLHRRGLLIS